MLAQIRAKAGQTRISYQIWSKLILIVNNFEHTKYNQLFRDQDTISISLLRRLSLNQTLWIQGPLSSRNKWTKKTTTAEVSVWRALNLLLIIEIEEQKQIMQLVGRNKISVMSQLSQKNGSVEERKFLGNDSQSTMRMQTNFSK